VHPVCSYCKSKGKWPLIFTPFPDEGERSASQASRTIPYKAPTFSVVQKFGMAAEMVLTLWV